MKRLWEEVKFVGSKALKWAAIGGLLAAGAALVVSSPVGIVATLLHVVPVVGPWLFGAVTSTIGSAALAGGVIAGALGAVKGLAGASKAADDAEDRILENKDRAQMHEQRAIAFAQAQQGKGGGMSASPGMMPMSRDRDRDSQYMG
jgi:hypothetical protein